MFGSEYPNTEISRQSFFLNNYCGYFIKEIPNGFLRLDTLIQTLGMLLEFRKAKNTHLAARVFLRFSQVSQHPRVWIRVSKLGKPLGISLMKDNSKRRTSLLPTAILSNFFVCIQANFRESRARAFQNASALLQSTFINIV